MVGAVVLAIAAVAVFGTGRFFARSAPVVVYFEESVAGLSVGAPVVFSGVTVGNVKRIELRYDLVADQVLIPVEFDFFIDRLGVTDPVTDESLQTLPPRRIVDGLVERGMRAQLGLGSLITGSLVVNLVMQPPDSPRRLVAADPETLELPDGRKEIPAIPSQMQEVRQAFEKAVRNFADLDTDALVVAVKDSLDGVRALVTDPELAEAITNANTMLGEMRLVVAKVAGHIDPMSQGATDALRSVQAAADEGRLAAQDARQMLATVRPVISGAETAIARATQVLETADDVIHPGSLLYFQLSDALREAGSAARSLRVLADTLEQNPGALIWGRTGGGR
ncbi:MAG: MCE family protein [Rhodospirillales bacterium]|nr:MAG: MCE family protein [Rhodospirillales bacterium]